MRRGLTARRPLQGNLWKRKGWKEMDKMRSKLEDLKELRDLVRAAYYSAPACIPGQTGLRSR